MIKAMVLAAGYGSRLGELTKDTPKCLIEVAGKPMLLRVIEKLQSIGCEEIVINTHYLSERVNTFVENLKLKNCKLSLSYEHELLGTGGALKFANHFFRDSNCFVLHNADIMSDLNLSDLLDFHKTKNAQVTIACQHKQVPRHLLFDENDLFLGWRNTDSAGEELVRTSKNPKVGHYLCAQVLSPEVLDYFMPFSYPFFLFEPYLAAVKAGLDIRAYWAENIFWADIGTPSELQMVRNYYSKQNGNN